MTTITADELEEVYRLECACGMTSGNVASRDAAKEIQEAHQNGCDEHNEITTGYIPGYA